MQVLFMWVWMILWPMWPEVTLRIHFWNIFIPLYLRFSSNVWVDCPLFPVPFRIRLEMLAARVLLEYFNILFELIKWSMTSLSEKSACATFSSSEAKYSCSSSAWLTCSNTACVALKYYSYCNLLYSNTKNILKSTHILSTLGFLCQF